MNIAHSLLLTLLSGLAFGVNASWAVDLRIDYRIYDNGNTDLDIVSREKGNLRILRAVVNYSSKAECILIPVASDYGASLLRSDLFVSPSLVSFPDQRPITQIDLAFGEFVTAVLPKDCGKLLAVEIVTTDGPAVFEF